MGGCFFERLQVLKVCEVEFEDLELGEVEFAQEVRLLDGWDGFSCWDG